MWEIHGNRFGEWEINFGTSPVMIFIYFHRKSMDQSFSHLGGSIGSIQPPERKMWLGSRKSPHSPDLNRPKWAIFMGFLWASWALKPGQKPYGWDLGFLPLRTRKMNESEVVFVAVFGQLSPENVIEPRKTMEKLTNKKESEMGSGPIIGSMSQQNIWIWYR